jgi:hypothetical protein
MACGSCRAVFTTNFDSVPVTLVYSKAFADIIQQNPNMIDEVYDFRNFM